jgi:hypothetical protein
VGTLTLPPCGGMQAAVGHSPRLRPLRACCSGVRLKIARAVGARASVPWVICVSGPWAVGSLASELRAVVLQLPWVICVSGPWAVVHQSFERSCFSFPSGGPLMLALFEAKVFNDTADAEVAHGGGAAAAATPPLSGGGTNATPPLSGGGDSDGQQSGQQDSLRRKGGSKQDRGHHRKWWQSSGCPRLWWCLLSWLFLFFCCQDNLNDEVAGSDGQQGGTQDRPRVGKRG